MNAYSSINKLKDDGAFTNQKEHAYECNSYDDMFRLTAPSTNCRMMEHLVGARVVTVTRRTGAPQGPDGGTPRAEPGAPQGRAETQGTPGNRRHRMVTTSALSIDAMRRPGI